MHEPPALPRFAGSNYTWCMPNYIRWYENGATYFFTVVTYDRREIFATDMARTLLRTAIESVRERLPFEMPAMVLLPDHLHCIWTLPVDDHDFSQRWQQIKGRFSHDFLAADLVERRPSPAAQKQRRRGIWQPRFYEHRIRDERDFDQHRDYIHLNPVKHGYVERPQDWAWSSIHRHIEKGWLDPLWPGSSPVELPEIQE